MFKVMIAVLFGLFFGGCVNSDLFDLDLSDIVSEMAFAPGLSLHRLYKEDDLTFDERLLGTWADKSGTQLIFKKAEEADAYILTLIDTDLHDTFITHLVNVDGMLFLDLFPDKPHSEHISLQQKLYVPGHMFIRIEHTDTNMKTEMVYFCGLIEKQPDLLKHEVVGESDILVTASTEELQEFLKRYRHNEDLFNTEPELLKVKEGDAVLK